MHKKGSFVDLFYLALIVSVLRTHNRIDDNVFIEQFGGSAVDELGPTSAVHMYFNNLRNSYSLESSLYCNSAKTNILYDETLNVLRDLQSLGRYSRTNRFHNSPVFAYLVSGGEQQRQESGLTAAIASTSSSAISSSVNTTETPQLVTQSLNDSAISNSSLDSSPTGPQPIDSIDDQVFNVLIVFFVMILIYLLWLSDDFSFN